MLTCHLQPGTTTKNWTYLHAHIDPGADVNLMPVSVYKCLTGDKKLQHLGPVQCTMTVYTNNTIQNLGSTLVYVKYAGKQTQKLIFNVTNQEGSVLLCCEDVLSLELIIPKDGLEEMEDEATFTSSTVDINQTSSVPSKQLVTSKDDIIRYFPEILEGLGKFPGEPYHINVDPSIPPICLSARPVPVHQQAAFKQQLDDMIQAGVIVPVTEATP